jgi:hypothetical protein
MFSHIVIDTELAHLGFKPGLAFMTKLLISSQIRGSPISLHPGLHSMMKLLVLSQSIDLCILGKLGVRSLGILGSLEFDLWAWHLTSGRRS